MGKLFKKIYSRKVTCFFLLHFTLCVMYYFNATDVIPWIMLINGFGFISFNSVDKWMRIRQNAKQFIKE